VVEPTAGEVYSPVNGSVTMLFDTKHAVGLMGDDGTEVLIHIGVDTVELQGAPFEAHVAAGDTVKAGQLLITADLDAIEAAGKPTATMVIVTNTDDYEAVTPTIGAIKAGEKLVTCTK
jgi:glucose-specific phosphotransferase system IIA component